MTLTENIVSLRRTMLRRLTARLAGETPRPFQQLRLLSVVARGQAETQSDVAELLVSDPAAVCRLVDRLSEDGLIERLPGKDRRSVRLQVTDAAKPHLKVMHSNTDWLENEIRSTLTDQEATTLERLLAKVQAGLVAK